MKKIINNLKHMMKKKNTNVLNLGRWNTQDNQDIKNILANADHCGDKICNDPKLINKLIAYIGLIALNISG